MPSPFCHEWSPKADQWILGRSKQLQMGTVGKPHVVLRASSTCDVKHVINAETIYNIFILEQVVQTWFLVNPIHVHVHVDENF